MIVDNTTDFEEKIRKTIGLISSVVGLPTDAQIFKKYLVSGPVENFPESMRVEDMTILETYLNVP